uniref:Sushi domain-containing protein n=1 Tax=Heterorhabditis bacteriophora TaxID=37862 RepID=A0A1I7WPC7_HETBA
MDDPLYPDPISHAVDKGIKTVFRCAGLPRCEFLVDAYLFDDPCPQTSKYLEATYSCAAVVVSWCVVRCDGYRECRFAVDNSFFIADPCPTTKKYLEVTYQCVFKLTTTTTTTTTSSTATTTTVFLTTNNDDVRKDLDSLSGNVHLSCPSTFQRGIGWSATFAGNIVQTPCPEGSRGMAIWECLENGSWNNEGPNTTKCESDWTVHRQDALNEAIREQDANGIPEVCFSTNCYHIPSQSRGCSSLFISRMLMVEPQQP